MPVRPKLLCFDDELAPAQRIAQAAGIELAVIERHRFPDGELKLRLPERLGGPVVLLRSLDHPNEKLVELLLAGQTARQLGATRLTLVAPYLAYMRQDMAFHPGEAVSQGIVGRFLASLFDAVITVDPHLHRVASLEQAVPVAHAVVLSGAPLLSDLIARHHRAPLLLGPDEESAQWVAQAARRHGFDHAVCHKVRTGDLQVAIALPDTPLSGRAVVLIDDVASSGRTLALAARLARQAGAASVDVAVTHALFADDALQVILEAGAREIWSTDCVAHSSNAVTIAPLLAQALQALHA
ncbi:ribose-phosphate diphosphokinase [Rhodoferax sp.]|uniref:ribose-phosphate diphosphokinase n=1 Tax=Rhodoferax sp. TaxID=50421 RepID=UPI0027437682|nr:ribose-phosphate diphosphokinase [Rhodoferax sp.]